MKIFDKLYNWYFSKKALPYWGILLLDCIIVAFAWYFSCYMQFGGLGFAQNFWKLTTEVAICTLIYVVAFRIFHTYSGIIRYSSFEDLLQVLFATTTGTAFIYIGRAILMATGHELTFMPRLSNGLFAFAMATMLMWLMRVMVKAIYENVIVTGNAKKAFVYGVREGGLSIAKSIQTYGEENYSLVGFISPDGMLNSKYLMGVHVYKDGPNVVQHMKDKEAQVLIVSPLQTEHFRENSELIDELADAGIKILMIPQAEEWDGKSELSHSQLREVEIEDLLPRNQIKVNMDAIGALLHGKKILITGAAGSIGSEMVRQVAIYKPAEMILIDQAETPMHDIRLMMKNQFPDIKNETIVASITNENYMEHIFSEHRPDYVFHAAAYKHVPMMEDNPAMAVQNNIYGTRVIADLAVKYGTKKFVMISTDKAVNPTNVMGCSKRICEIYCQSLNQALDKEGASHCQFVTTRFGNVLGSNGSVIPIFKEQIKNGGPITVTHPDIIRYFMLIPEACKLVLEAGTMGHGGEIYVFDMGQPVKIVNLAKRMIKLSGAKDIEIKFTGLRDGEKLYEEVLSDEENTVPTDHPKIKIAKVREYDYETACKNEERLMEVSQTLDDMEIVKVMKEIVPEYKSRVSKYEVLDRE